MRVSQALGALVFASLSTALDNENTNSASGNTIQRRNAEIEARLADELVYGVRKMSTDEGEKFYLDYWHFEDAVHGDGGLSERDLAGVNTTAASDANSQKKPVENTGNGFSPAQFLARSYAFNPSFGPEFGVRGSSLESRDFKCPSDTIACTSINRSDRCCSAGDTCVIVTDTGSGDVGCCPKGQTCSGTIGPCQSGYTTCSTALGGGCCIPGYECVEGGCKCIFPLNKPLPQLITIPTRCIYLRGYRDNRLDRNRLYSNPHYIPTNNPIHIFQLKSQLHLQHLNINFKEHQHGKSHPTSPRNQHNDNNPLINNSRRCLPNRFLRLLSRLQRRLLSNEPKLRHNIMPGDVLDDIHVRW